MEEMHTATYREGAWSFYTLGEHCSPHISMCSPTQNYRLLGLLDCPGSLKSKAQFLKNQIKKNKEREHTHTHTHTPQKQKLNYSLQDSGSIRIFLLEEDIFILGLKRMSSIQTQLGTRGTQSFMREHQTKIDNRHSLAETSDTGPAIQCL